MRVVLLCPEVPMVTHENMTATTGANDRATCFAAAKRANLRYVADDKPGIQRVRCGHGFRYRSPRGNTITDKRTLDRIRRLAVPPAWSHVWICPSAFGHLQATGRDAKG